MDDFSMFGQKPILPQAEAWHNNQRRKAFDIIRICNPTDKDLFVEYDTNQHQRIPANCTMDVPRHIAERYIVHMKDRIVHDMAQKMHDDFIAERRLKGFPDYKDKAAENAETYQTASYPKGDDPKLMAEIMSKLWIGIVAEYGKDVLPKQNSQNSMTENLTPTVEKILASFSNRRVDLSDKQAMYQPEPIAPEAPQQAPVATQPAVSSFSSMNETLNKRITPEDVTA